MKRGRIRKKGQVKLEETVGERFTDILLIIALIIIIILLVFIIYHFFISGCYESIGKPMLMR